MGSFFNVHRGILLFSVVLVGLLFWLSISFVMVAHSEKRETDFLKLYIATDKILRNASIVIAQERSASYWLSGIDELYNVSQTLVRPRAHTDEAIAALFTQYEAVMSLPQYGDHLKFRRGHIETLLADVKAGVASLAAHRKMLDRNLDLPLNQRNQNLELEVLDFYQALVEKSELLRYSTTYVASRQARATQNLFVISNAIWDVQLSNQLLGALFEGYLTSGSVARGDAIIRANRQLAHLQENIEAIRRTDSYASIDVELNNQVSELESWYSSSYAEPVRNISISMTENKPSIVSDYEWKKLSRQMAEYTEKILNKSEVINQQRVEKVNQRAKRNLIIDYILVLLCVVLVLLAYLIVRRVHYQATHDVLTGLPNRRHFLSGCQQRIGADSDAKVTLIKADLSKFKNINDSFGQYSGDKLLQQVASRLQVSFDKSSTISRLDSDEFAVLMEGADKIAAEKAANKLADTVSGHYQIDGQSMNLKACVGFACCPSDSDNSEGLLKAADLALYESKQSGAGTITRFESSIADLFHERQQLESELADALKNGEFELHYQPQFDVGKQLVDGVEALIRWRHPDRGLVSPFHFISIAEDAGMLPAIGEWVINEAVRQSVFWKKEEGLDLRVSVNVSAHQFLEGDVVSTIQSALEREGLSPASFEIEITESVAMTDVGTVVDKLNTLHETGIRIALDDFGTGYSSLSYLQDLPLDTLKIDRSFVTKLDSGIRSQRLLFESIASMAKQLELHTVAEGVETDSQLEQVCALGIDTIQGYYYSKPVCANDIPGDVKAIDATYALDKAA